MLINDNRLNMIPSSSQMLSLSLVSV